ncbi:hypothetical protein PLICRDRAFT_180256 [Plicaturopsis crispa FD-325 SS-3]|uniref:Uncharacterized protein n=1 Tax=Plicaturopsis crispa FD-325 SS-3 TaxID=944288 RepID=A0A0C9T319_PLICR|nr:hypothetical protein PLICRDRAFT_180256 [Plicaturopsis crispa FD-325 SS-3]
MSNEVPESEQPSDGSRLTIYPNTAPFSNSQDWSHVELRNQFLELRKNYQHIKEENLALKVENKTLRQVVHTPTFKAYDKLVTTLPRALTAPDSSGLAAAIPSPAIPPLLQSDYPNVKFWRKSTYTSHMKASAGTTDLHRGPPQRGHARMAGGINVKMLYVEDKNGTPVDGYVAQHIREYARSIWNNLAKVGRAPRVWKRDGNAETLREYWREMGLRFPLLRLCESDWKADQIAIDYYPSWTQGQLGMIKMKLEEHDDPLAQARRATSRKPSGKRSLAISRLAIEFNAKKQKLEAPGPSTSAKPQF